MGVYIKNMKIPETCDKCLSGFVKTINCDKRMNFNDRDKRRHPECPCFYVPDEGKFVVVDGIAFESK